MPDDREDEDYDKLTNEQKAVLKAKQAAEEHIAKRIRMRDSILKEFVPVLTGGGPGPGGSIGKAAHLSSMQAEGVAAALIMDLIVFLVQLICNTPYLMHKVQFDRALKKQLSEMAKGNDIQLVYLPDDTGKYPTVYKMDEDGNIDFSEKYRNGEAPDWALGPQGLLPVPSRKRGYLAAIDMHIERELGTEALTDAQKYRLRNMIDVARPEVDRVADAEKKRRDYLMAQAKRPAPRPGGGPM